MSFAFEPIGFVRSPFVERAEAPRQAVAEGAKGIEGRIELLAGRGFEDALEGLDAFTHLWILFVFHRNVEEGRGFNPKVLPPRADRKVGLFASRSPHRPNPIGMSAVELDRIEGRVVHVRNLDLLDGTPVLDLKPYVPYADAYPQAGSGWLEPRDAREPWQVTFRPEAEVQLAWLRERGVDLRRPAEMALALGPQPHAYRRIRRHDGGLRLALKEWRIDFSAADARCIVVHRVASGYRPRERETRAELGLHREFTARFRSG